MIFDDAGHKSVADTLSTVSLDAGAPGTTRVLIPGVKNGQISPDGQWFAYERSRSDGWEVYVQPFPGPGPRTQISTDGGRDALWSRDGRELFYANGDRLMGVDVRTTPAFAAGAPRVVMQGRFRPTPNTRTPFDIAPDGRFLRIQQVQPERLLIHLDVVLNWLEELKQRVPVK